MAEPWESSVKSERFHLEIKRKIFCELVNAIKDVNSETRRKVGDVTLDAIPAYYGVQVEISLQASENSSLAPSVTYSPFINAAQPLNLGFAGELSSAATRTDVLNAYWDVGRIAGRGRNDQECNKNQVFEQNSSLLTESDLGIKAFLESASLQANQFPSSLPPDKTTKTDVYSYQIKFEIVSNGSINPGYKLTQISGNTGSGPFLSAGRTRVHYLLLTFGPNQIIDPNKIQNSKFVQPYVPSPSAVNSHFASQIGIAIQNAISSSR